MSAGVRVWDLPTRLFHWLLALLVTASAVTGKFGDILGADTLAWHMRSGYAILALLVFRIAWGFAGGTHARFASFLRGPSAVLAYAKAMAVGNAVEPPGHNPLGGWSVAAMLAALAVQVSAGLFIVQEDFGIEGPLAKYASGALSDRMDAIHAANFWVIAALVALHLAAVAFHDRVKGHGLARAMVTGRKRLGPGREAEASRGGGLAAGIAIAAASAAAVWGLVTYA